MVKGSIAPSSAWLPSLVFATLLCLSAAGTAASCHPHRRSSITSLMQRSYVKSTNAVVSEDVARVDDQSSDGRGSLMQRSKLQHVPVVTTRGTYVKSSLNAPCPFGSRLINDQSECFWAYRHMEHAQGWTGGAISGTWHWVMQCGVHIAHRHGMHNGNTKVHFKTNLHDGKSPAEDWVHICKVEDTYAIANPHSSCPSGYVEMKNFHQCRLAYNWGQVAHGWDGFYTIGGAAKHIQRGGTVHERQYRVMRCGVHVGYSHRGQPGRKQVIYRGNTKSDRWWPICNLKYVKSRLNWPCPSGYALINNENECYEAYNSMKVAQGWTGGTIRGGWHHVMQCGVHIAFGRGLNNGNTKVHFKTNGVDGSSPGEDWVHLCKAI